MKINWIKKTVSLVLAGAMVVCLATAADKPLEIYAEESKDGKYVSDVYIAYGKTEDEAKKWLEDNGWEPVEGDFNAGKASFFDNNKAQDQNVAAVMGIKRTDSKYAAITDMAVMNMKGGYSYPDYEALVEEKKANINEFINTFLPVLAEYRANYNGEGSASGKKRAQLAYDTLNKFYDGGEDDPYAKNDTGEHLGTLFLESIRQEGNENGADMEQILMESSGAAVIAIETALSMATDPSQETWLERASGLTGEDMADNLEKYVPEAAGQDVAPSAQMHFLSQRFGDASVAMASQWEGIHEEMLWYESYNKEHDLWPHDGESDEDNGTRIKKYFDALEKDDPKAYSSDYKRYFAAATLYIGMYDTPFEGDWGESLGDFFNPADGQNYGENADNFLPLAAALSDGQRAALKLLPLSSLIMLGFQTEGTVEELIPNVDEILGDAKEISIYSGMNRGIFRGGVALTSNALMEQGKGYDPFQALWNFSGIYNITCYSAAIASIPLMGAGIGLLVANKPSATVLGRISWLDNAVDQYKTFVENEIEYITEVKNYGPTGSYESEAQAYKTLRQDFQQLYEYNEELNGLQAEVDDLRSMQLNGRILIGIGGALLVAAAFAKGYQMYRYYNKTFTQIPTMIVDEADIVTYTKDKDGNEVKNIDFDQYVYYQAVRCNRQEVGEIGDWQDGVEMYSEWGCGDVADLNADMGQEWVALYTVKSSRKGDPILADSLTLQYGKDSKPDGCSVGLHLFTYTNTVDLGDTAWSFNNDKKGVYFFWDVDKQAFAKEAASTFGRGHLALAGIGGLILGMAGATLVLTKKRRKDEPEAA